MGFVEDFFSTLQIYNETILSITVLTYMLGFIAVYLASRKPRQAGKFVSFILSFLWLWSGIVFHILFFGPVDVEVLGMTIPGVWYISGILFIIQSLLFIILGVVKDSLSFSLDSSLYSIFGAILIIYSMAVYPLIGFLTGYPYPKYPLFGAAPCPVTIFTLGFLLWTDKKVPMLVVIIPFIWGIMGLMPVLVANIYADIGLILSGVAGFPLILLHNKRIGKSAT